MTILSQEVLDSFSAYGLHNKICPVCGREFRTGITLETHIAKEHPGLYEQQDES